MPATVLVTGSRNWTDGRRILERLRMEPDGTTVIQGECRGADTFAKHAALALGFQVICVPAKWARFGHGAGPMRNREMLDMKPTLVIAFRVGESKGTMDCVREAMARGIPVELIDA